MHQTWQTRSVSKKTYRRSLNIANVPIQPAISARNLGVIVTNDLGIDVYIYQQLIATFLPLLLTTNYVTSDLLDEKSTETSVLSENPASEKDIQHRVGPMQLHAKPEPYMEVNTIRNSVLKIEFSNIGLFQSICTWIINPNLPDPVNFVPFGTMTYSPFDINLMSITCIKFVYLYFCLFLNKA